MATTLVTNTSAMVAGFNLEKASKKVGDSIERLSSGNRIVKAGDDVASLAVGEQFKAAVGILKSAFKNASQATSMLGVADGSLQAIGEILQRQSSLASQAASGSLDPSARQYLDQEFQGLVEEINRIATATNFNSIKLIDGSLDKAASKVETATKVDASESTLKIKFGNNTTKYDNIGAQFATTNASNDVVITLNNHGLSNGDTISVKLGTSADIAGIVEADMAATAITVIDANSFKITAANPANATGNQGANGDGIFLQGTLAKSYDLLDGNTLNINGIIFTAKNTDTIANNYTGALGEIKTSTAQSADDISTNVKSAIDAYISGKGANYEKLLGIQIEQNPSDSAELIFTHKSRGVVGDTFFIETANGTKITGGATKINSDATFKASGATTGALTMMNTDVYGTIKDDIINSFTGDKATASFTIANNPDATVDAGDDIAAGDISVNADGSALYVTRAGHGYKGGETINFAGNIALTAGSGMTANAGDYTVRVLDEDHFEIYGSNLTGTFTGFKAASTGAAAFTHSVPAERGDRITVNGKEFKYVTNATNDDEITIGADISETTRNTIEVLNRSLDPRVSQATYSGVPDTGVITATYKAKGTNTEYNFTLGGNMRSTNLTITNSQLTGGTATSGIDLSKVTNNDEFVGKIQGFTSKYISNNKIDLEIKVGDYTYKASGVDTKPTANNWVTLISEEGGGSFKIQLAANKGTNVTDQTSADVFANRLNNAFSELKVTQRRQMTSFNADGLVGDIYDGTTKTGSLSGAALFFTNDKFEDIKIEGIKFHAPGAGQTDARIEMVIDGQKYVTSSGIGNAMSKGSLVKLTNENDSNKFVELRIGNTDLDLTTDSRAAAAEKAYNDALKLGDTSDAGVEFQVGTEATDIIKMQIGSTKTDDIYKDDAGSSQILDITTAANANSALSVIQNAIQKVTSIRAQVGVYQSRFGYASTAINASIQNQDAARSEFLDTKVETEASELIQSQVRLSASISVLTNANQITQNLLQLIRT